MEDSHLRQLKYLIESSAPWQPNKLVLHPWERGLATNAGVHRVIKTTAVHIFRMLANHDQANDSR